MYIFTLLGAEEHISYPEHPFQFLPCLAEEVFEPHVVDHILSLMLTDDEGAHLDSKFHFHPQHFCISTLSYLI